MKGKMMSSKTMEKQGKKETMTSTWIDGKAMEKLRDYAEEVASNKIVALMGPVLSRSTARKPWNRRVKPKASR